MPHYLPMYTENISDSSEASENYVLEMSSTKFSKLQTQQIFLFIDTPYKISKPICQSCVAGKYSASTATVCTDCPANFVTASIASTSINDCACNAGYNLVNDVCEPCPVGHFKNIPSNFESCLQCADNFFSSSLGSVECLPCQNNTVSTADRSGCLCDLGFYRHADYLTEKDPFYVAALQ